MAKFPCSFFVRAVQSALPLPLPLPSFTPTRAILFYSITCARVQANSTQSDPHWTHLGLDPVSDRYLLKLARSAPILATIVHLTCNCPICQILSRDNMTPCLFFA